MPDGIYALNGAAGVYGTEEAAAAGKTRAAATEGALPQAVDELAALLTELELPDLPASMKPVSLDTLLQAVGDEDRRNAIKKGVDSLAIQGEKMEAENAKKLQDIAKQLEKMKEQKKLSIFQKIFKIIGIIVGAVAAAATIAVGAVTANPALIVAGVIGAIGVADSILSEATDGKFSIQAGFAELGKKLGMSDEAAKWFGFGMNLAVIAGGVIAGFCGASAAAKAAEQAVEVGSKLNNVLARTSEATQIVGGVNNVGLGATTIGAAIVDYQVAKLQAHKVDIDAILESIRNSMKLEQDLIENQMELAENLIGKVKDIVEECGQANTALLTSNPSMA